MDKCDAYTPVRWMDRRCDKPAQHVVLSDGQANGHYCDECWAKLHETLVATGQVLPRARRVAALLENPEALTEEAWQAILTDLKAFPKVFATLLHAAEQ